MLNNNNIRVHHFAQAGVTIATRPHDVYADMRAVAIAVTHPGDTFTRKRGAQVALGRLNTRRGTSPNWLYVGAAELHNAIRDARTLCMLPGGAPHARRVLKDLILGEA